MTELSGWIVLDPEKDVVGVYFGNGPMSAIFYHASGRTASPYDSVGVLREGYRAYPVKLETEPECHVYDHGFSESVVYLCPAEQCGLLSYGYEVVGENGEYGKDWWLACNECKTKVKKIGYEEAVALIEGGHCKFEKED